MHYFIITCHADGKVYNKRIVASDYRQAMQIALACTKGYVLESVKPEYSVA